MASKVVEETTRSFLWGAGEPPHFVAGSHLGSSAHGSLLVSLTTYTFIRININVRIIVNHLGLGHLYCELGIIFANHKISFRILHSSCGAVTPIYERVEGK